MLRGSRPMLLPTKVLARQTSSVVMPIRRRGSWTPAFLYTSAAMGTVEFTGLGSGSQMEASSSAHHITHQLSYIQFTPIW